MRAPDYFSEALSSLKRCILQFCLSMRPPFSFVLRFSQAFHSEVVDDKLESGKTFSVHGASRSLYLSRGMTISALLPFSERASLDPL